MFDGIGERAGAVAQSRLLGAGQARRQSSGRTICVSSPRTTATRSIAGRRCRRWRRGFSSTTSRRCARAATCRSDAGLLEALGAILADASARARLRRARAHAAGEADIAREIGRDVDPDAIFTARTACVRPSAAHLGEALARALPAARRDRALSSGCRRRRPPRAAQRLPRSHGRGARSSGAIALAAQQYESADNMTDRMAALQHALALRRPRAARPRSTISTPAMPAIR